ncbi:MAG: ATP-binding cassette domain-containing protein [Bacteroidetes bacterium]|jgi:ATP-binding cassette subfamily F protein 3|nr:ATP-binding cassette domain-containing protein [Bacteroidota bacterium]
MIQLNDIHLAFAGEPVLEGLSWTITPDRQRIGLIGPNGAGKSTVLRVITEQHTPQEGTVAIGNSTTVGYLEQDAQELDTERPVIEEALRAFGHVKALEAEEEEITDALSAADDYESDRYQKLLHRLSDVQQALVTHEAHRLQSRTEAVLAGLGFEPDELERPVRSFSGGWRMRVALAKLLLRNPDFLLLDEPTNHLDIQSIDWLEGYLRAYEGTVVIVSHDRYFLDRMVTTIAELTHGQVTIYNGNYSYYLEEREHRRELQRQRYENQQREIKEIERFIERFRYKADKAAMVQSRIKHLDKMERVPPPPSEDSTVTIRFPEPRRSGRIVLELSRFSKTYATAEGTVEVFDDADPLTIERGEKIALIGKNGAGKSTLARILRGVEDFDGTREEGHNVDMTYFAQHQAEALNPAHTVLESVRELAPDRTETELRTMLGAFLFTGDDVFKPVTVLSGGEKSRVALARTLLHPANFLILDEPTNHLDIQSINVLTEALQQYSGTFVIVSHDRHFLDEVANTVWHVGGGRVQDFPGTYSEYRWHLEHGSVEAPDTSLTAAAASNGSSSKPSAHQKNGPKSKAQKREEAAARQRQANGRNAPDYSTLNSYKLQSLYEETETDILAKEEKKEALEEAMADPDLYSDHDRAKEVNANYAAIEQELATLYERWEALAEELTAEA